jgi:uncharacterized protein (DUF1778 family)
MTDEERDLGQAAAATRGQTLSEFVRQAARREAEQVLAERTSIALNPEEADRFLAGLDDPSSFEAGLGALTERPSVHYTLVASQVEQGEATGARIDQDE